MNHKIQSRNLWPVAITVFFILAAIFLTTFVAWAMHQREDLVSANYYENEIRYQQQLERLNRSQPLTSEIVVGFDIASRSIVINLPATHARDAAGQIHLYRPSDARLDLELPLALDATGVQRCDATQLRDGLWKVRVQWTTGGKEYFVDRSVVVTSGQP